MNWNQLNEIFPGKNYIWKVYVAVWWENKEFAKSNLHYDEIFHI